MREFWWFSIQAQLQAALADRQAAQAHVEKLEDIVETLKLVNRYTHTFYEAEKCHNYFIVCSDPCQKRVKLNMSIN